MRKSNGKNKIGVMSIVHEGRIPFGKQTYFFEDMVRSIGMDKGEIFFFSPMEWQSGAKEISGYNFLDNSWIETKSTIPGIIYDRAFSKDEVQKVHIESLREYLRANGNRILNPFELADLLNNKIDFHAFLIKNNIPTLGTFPFNILKDSHFFGGIDASKVYVKPTFGSKGEGIFVIEKKSKEYLLYDHLGMVETFHDYRLLHDKLVAMVQFPDRYFVQEEAITEWFEESPFDIRVLVQNYGKEYKVTGMAIRIGQKRARTSNLNSGGNAVPLEELEDFFNEKYQYAVKELRLEMERICLKCSELLRRQVGEFCEIGFDILLTKDRGPIILEGNAKPSRWVFVKIADYLKNKGKDHTYYLERRKETVSVPMKYALYLLGK